jgi:glutamate synthase (NADPH/NADH) large chain
VLGEKANATRPEIEQIIISNAKGVDEETFERELYVIRRRIEKAAAAAGIKELYLCSLSCRSIIYKGMMLAEQVAEFYPDLKDERFESAFAIYHQRYSTNTFPQWWLAQPFRMLAHNGEINTLKGNVNWMKSHEIRLASAYFGEMAEDIKPIIAQGASDRRRLTRCSRCWCARAATRRWPRRCWCPRHGRTGDRTAAGVADMYSYCNSVMEPWDGPAALAMTDGRWVCAGLDRNGLRPMRYVVTGDGLMIAGSETGMVPVDEATVVEKGALGPGPDDRRRHGRAASCSTTPRSRTRWPPRALRRVGRQDHRSGRGDARRDRDRPVRRGRAAPRQVAAGYSIEELEQILAPMAEDGKESLASMGDDTPAAVLSSQYRPLSHYFRQNFSQVTNPPIDSLREYRVMSLKTRFGNLKNVLDEDVSQTEILVLDSPFVANAQFDEMVSHFGDSVVDRLHLPRTRPPTRCAGAGADPVGGGGCRALGRGPHHPDRSGAGRDRCRCR